MRSLKILISAKSWFLKSLAVLFFTICFHGKVYSQDLQISWSKTYGGSGSDHLAQVKKVPGGGYVAVGFTTSSNGDIKEANKGLLDFWIIKIDDKNELLWSKTFGGSQIDAATSVVITKDGGCIAVGYTESNNFDVFGNHGDSDIWAIKLSSSGDLEWKKCFGGLGFDEGRDIIATNDGNFVIAARATKNSMDMLIIKINQEGNIIWQKYFGGGGGDEAWSIKQTLDDGYIMTGATNSNNGDVVGNHGNRDFWIVKLNNEGDLQWQKCLGGTDYFGLSNSVVLLTDGTYLITGHVFQKSPFTNGNNDISKYYGNWDSWCVKINDLGTIVWQNSPGIVAYDWTHGAISTIDGGAIVVGGKPVRGNDFWVFKLKNDGNLDWQISLGGTGNEEAYSIDQDGCSYIISGATTSTSGDVSNNHGGQDGWLVKLSAKTVHVSISTLSDKNCPGQKVTFNSTVTKNVNNLLYQWIKNGNRVGTNVDTYTDNELVDGDEISLIVSNGCDNFSSNKIIVNIQSFNLQAVASKNDVYVGELINIYTSANSNYVITSWEPSNLFLNQTSMSQTLAPLENVTIKITAISENGCPDTFSLDLRVKPKDSNPGGQTRLIIPNVFSPNGDGINDKWSPINLFEEASITIFDRIGRIVYSNSKYRFGDFWDGRLKGKDIPVGVYYYLIDLSKTSLKYTGSITIIK